MEIFIKLSMMLLCIISLIAISLSSRVFYNNIKDLLYARKEKDNLLNIAILRVIKSFTPCLIEGFLFILALSSVFDFTNKIIIILLVISLFDAPIIYIISDTFELYLRSKRRKEIED